MARMPRLVVPGYPHHVTQRGNRRQQTFFSEEDYHAYIQLLTDARDAADVQIWSYCLMPNHVHLVVVPTRPDSLADLFKEAHRRYTRLINTREGWRGHLWQERFHSFVMDEQHLLAAVRYVELNPVRAKLCRRAEHWVWSSALAHLNGTDDALVTVAPMLERISNWANYLDTTESAERLDALRGYSRTGRPAGNGAFIQKLSSLTGRELRKGKPGPKTSIK
jgi:putative transposase